MSDDSYTTGSIAILPPLTYKEMRDSDFIAENGRRGQSVKFHVHVEKHETDTGENIVRTATEIVPVRDGHGVSYHLAENVREIMQAFPGHRFEGEFLTYPEPLMCQFPSRVLVGGASVVEQTAEPVWSDKK